MDKKFTPFARQSLSCATVTTSVSNAPGATLMILRNAFALPPAPSSILVASPPTETTPKLCLSISAKTLPIFESGGK